MRDYVIVTDSSCDLTSEMAEELGLLVLPLTVLLDGKSYANYLDGREISFADFYGALREGKMATTSAVNVDAFSKCFREQLEAGKDVLYLGFSSGLSATYQDGAIAAEEIRAEFPEQKIFAVDTLCASLGQGLIVYLAARKKRDGMDIETLKTFVEELRSNVCHWVLADDLHHLKRGGRVSAAAAIFGSALSIKPIIKMNDEGSLNVVDKMRGRKNGVKKLYETMKATALDLTGQTIFLSHADCLEDAEALAAAIRSEQPVEDVFINYIGPVIGAHTGPGTLALFYLGKQR